MRVRLLRKVKIDRPGGGATLYPQGETNVDDALGAELVSTGMAVEVDVGGTATNRVKVDAAPAPVQKTKRRPRSKPKPE